jgi:predicted RNA-binding Zn-ribbon protein involved in translation (DUF1610 family)
VREGLDSLFGRIAMGMGYVRPEQLLECIKEQQESGAGEQEPSSRKLGEIMLSRGIITSEQRDEVLVMQEAMLARKTDSGRKKSLGEMLLGQVAVREGFLGRRQLERCLRIQATCADEGKHRRLGKIMLELGYLQPEDLFLLLKLQSRTLMECVSCGTKYNVEGYKNNKAFLCKKCGSSLRVCTDASKVAADDTIVFEILREIEDDS